IFGPGCIYRKAALSALDEAGIPYRLAYESPSRAGLECAVNAGLAVTVAPKDLVTHDLRVLQNTEDGFPALPILDTFVFATPSNRSPSVNAVLSLLNETVDKEI
ncbi:MAG: LysR substrate-binding domain-containing protein, partial [Pseudomonadota bacterium]